MPHQSVPAAKDPETILRLLEQTALKLEITIRFEPISVGDDQSVSTGGLCRLRGKNILFINDNLTAGQKCTVISSALKKFDLDKIFIPPVIRDLLVT